MSTKSKILIVDDDSFIIDMYVMKFQAEGFEVYTTTEGKEVVEKIKEFQPDIVLLDIVMPGLSGFEILKNLQKEKFKKKPKIVFLTNLGERQDIERGRELGADDYIIKAHFTPQEVVDKIRTLLN